MSKRVNSPGIGWFTLAWPKDNMAVRWSQTYLRMPYELACNITSDIDAVIKTFSSNIEGKYYISKEHDSNIVDILAFENMNDFIMFKMTLDYNHSKDLEYKKFDEYHQTAIFDTNQDINFMQVVYIAGVNLKNLQELNERLTTHETVIGDQSNNNLIISIIGLMNTIVSRCIQKKSFEITAGGYQWNLKK